MTRPRFETMQSAGLEELLRRPDLPAEDRQAIQRELGRRIAGNLSGGPAPAPQSPPVGTPMPAAVPAQASAPPPPVAPPRLARPQYVPTPPQQPAQTPAPRRRSGRAAVGAFVAVTVFVAAVAAIVLYLLNNDDDPPPTQYGDTCYATDVYCPLAQEAPLGAPCQCFDSVGLAHTGTVG